MKRLIALIISIMPIVSVAQDSCLNFSIIDQKVVWEKIYECDLDQSEIKNHFRQSGIFKVNDLADGFISGEIEKTAIDYKKFGYRWGSTHVFLNLPISVTVIIDFKDNKYRVTLRNIQFINDKYLKPDITEIETLFTSKDKFSKNFVNVSGRKMDDFLVDLFTIKQLSKTDW